jgi:hypothetical protein
MMYRGQQEGLICLPSLPLPFVLCGSITYNIQQGIDRGNGKVKFSLEQAMKA